MRSPWPPSQSKNRAAEGPYRDGMELRRHFTDHPATVGESYLEHMKVASGFARTLAKATVACTVHAIVPSMCEKTASTAIKDLHARMTAGARGDHADTEVAPISIAS